MTGRLNEACREYYSAYEEGYEQLRHVAKIVREDIRRLVADAGLHVHSVEARAKRPGSVLSKLRRKNYDNPRTQLTDLIGIRIITVYRRDVDGVVSAIRGQISIDEANSVDRRSRLDLREFGYRSVHLVTTLGELHPLTDDDRLRLDLRVEMQVRSLLEHAWAEIEHEVVYKSGVEYSEEMLRDFAAVAGTLELVDRTFERFTIEFHNEVQRRYDALANTTETWALELDSASLIAVLEVLVGPDHGWRSERGQEFPRHSAGLVVEGLRAVGLTTAHSLRNAYQSAACQEAIRTFAAEAGLAEGEVSHYAIGVMVCATQDGFPVEDYPDLLSDQRIRSIVP